MWIVFAFGSALFAGLTAVLAKCGIRKTDSTVATAVRTIVVLAFAWLMVFVVGSQNQIQEIGRKTFVFLILSGLATGASWLCYFKALQTGDINKVVPIDKSSTVLTIILAFFFLKERISLPKAAGVLLIAAGTYLMIEKKAAVKESVHPGKYTGKPPEENGTEENRSGDSLIVSLMMRLKKRLDGGGWMLFAFGSAIFASLTAILGKIGITGVESNLGTAIRTGVVLIMSWMMVAVTGKQSKVKEIPKRELGFICLSGLATGASWLCYYKALQDGPASVVVPVDKLSILVTIAFSGIVFHEKLSRRAAAGLIAIVAGTLVMLF